MDWGLRHCLTLKELKHQVLGDIEIFIPDGYFTKKKPKISLHNWARFNGHPPKDKAHAVKNEPDTQKTWGDYAVELGNELLHNPQKSILTARQIAASRLLIDLGNYFLKPTNDTVDLYGSITRYFKYLSEEDKRPFLSLLANESEEPKRQVTEEPKRRVKQREEILRIVRELGHDPLKLPVRGNGDSWVKCKIKKKLNIPNELFSSERVFNKVWQEMRDVKELKETGN